MRILFFCECLAKVMDVKPAYSRLHRIACERHYATHRHNSQYGIGHELVTIPNTELDINYVEVRCLYMSLGHAILWTVGDVEALKAAAASKRCEAVIDRENEISCSSNIRNIWSQPNEKLHNFAS